jgi:hypothetical protein
MDKKGKIATIVIIALLAIMLTTVVIAKRGGGEPKPECNDGIDNDGDGFVDHKNSRKRGTLKDPGCTSKNDNDETNCGDGVCEGGETSLSCASDCGPAQVCGNNVVEGTEVCDGTDLAGESCSTQGFDGGLLDCNSGCSGYDTSACFTNTCLDSDGGFVTGLSGTVSGDFGGAPYSVEDYCSNTTLTENYCAGSLAFSAPFECDTGNSTTICVNGACV